jgi:serine/threonine protein kinase
VKLADLGLAIERAAVGSDSGGTLPFMAPEIFDDPTRFSRRSDLYALGVTLACLALDEPPYPRDATARLLEWIRSPARAKLGPLRPDLPPELAGVIDRLMAPQAGARPQTAAEALAALPARVEAARAASGPSVGPWILGAIDYKGANWLVHRATHSSTGAPAVVSLVQPGSAFAAHPDRVLLSAERAASLDHPGLLPVIDWGTHAGKAFVVTAARGRTFRDIVTGGKPLDEAEALDVGAALAEVLAYLHERKLAYQVVGPGTAQVARDGRTVQLAWPVYCAEAGRKGPRVVILPYGAPETVKDAPADARTGQATMLAPGKIAAAADVYGLGEVLWFLLAGASPWKAKGAELVAAKGKAPDVRERAPKTTAPTGALVARLMSADPKKRPEAAEAQTELKRLLARLKG